MIFPRHSLKFPKSIFFFKAIFIGSIVFNPEFAAVQGQLVFWHRVSIKRWFHCDEHAVPVTKNIAKANTTEFHAAVGFTKSIVDYLRSHLFKKNNLEFWEILFLPPSVCQLEYTYHKLISFDDWYFFLIYVLSVFSFCRSTSHGKSI